MHRAARPIRLLSEHEMRLFLVHRDRDGQIPAFCLDLHLDHYCTQHSIPLINYWLRLLKAIMKSRPALAKKRTGISSQPSPTYNPSLNKTP